MNLAEARLQVVDAALWSKNDYDDCQIDRAIQETCHDFVNYTGCTRENVNVSLTASSTSVDLTSTTALAQLQPQFFDHARIGTREVRRVDHHWVRRRLDAYPNQTGQPTHIGFETPTLAWLFPKTDIAYTLVVTHNPPFIAFTPGTATAVTLNIPERFVRPALWMGCATALCYGEQVENTWPLKGREMYLAYREEIKQMAQMESGLPVGTPYAPKLPAAPQKKAS